MVNLSQLSISVDCQSQLIMREKEADKLRKWQREMFWRFGHWLTDWLTEGHWAPLFSFFFFLNSPFQLLFIIYNDYLIICLILYPKLLFTFHHNLWFQFQPEPAVSTPISPCQPAGRKQISVCHLRQEIWTIRG